MAKLWILLLLLALLNVSHVLSKRKKGRHSHCEDKEKKECKGWKAAKFCLRTSQWYDYMVKNCKKTCGFCEEGSLCQDKEKRECPGWKKNNFCLESSQWFGYMKENCKKTCGFCEAAFQTDTCKDDNEECSEWAGKGECKKNPGYMNKNCRLSCGLCKATKSECKDKNEGCPEWAKKGECNKNPGFMNKNCRLSCGTCGKETGGCKDAYDTTKCQQWAEAGQCNKNVDWMKLNCQKSCNKCSGSGTSTSVVKEEKHTDINSMYCGLRLKARVVGGTEAAVGDWPWQVGIASKSRPDFPFCGGSLINRQWVVTASHCFGSRYSTKYKPSNIVVLIAEHDLRKVEGREIISNVSMILRNNRYLGYGAYDNDITLIKLEKPIKYNYLIKPICLPAPNKEEKAGKMCYITGWGRLGTYKKVAKVLQEAKVPIVDRKTCKATLNIFSSFTDNMICAGYSKGGIDACQGDSGGPLVCDNGGRFELEGIVSWGRGCGDANSYGAYTKVSKYIDWIKTNIKK